MSLISTILHKRSSIPDRVPAVSSLEIGEIAINAADAKLFIKSADNNVHEFLSQAQNPYTLIPDLTGSAFQVGNNTISETFGCILGGYNNTISGAGSTIVNGESNQVAGDLSIVGCGLNNQITVDGDYSGIIGGQNNVISHANCFALGSNLSSHAENFTYTNNISGTHWGDGKHLTNVAVITSVPNTHTAPGIPGYIAYDSQHFYICISPNVWGRANLGSNW
jgi:hypothetical protein